MQTSPSLFAAALAWVAIGTAIALHMHDQCKQKGQTDMTFPLALLLGLTAGPIMYALALVHVFWRVYVKGEEIK